MPDSRTVAQAIVDDAAAENANGAATVGLVVGATRSHGLDLSALNGPILSPGLGAQGATAADIPEVFSGADTCWLLPASSRGLLGKGPMSRRCARPASPSATISRRLCDPLTDQSVLSQPAVLSCRGAVRVGMCGAELGPTDAFRVATRANGDSDAAFSTRCHSRHFRHIATVSG